MSNKHIKNNSKEFKKKGLSVRVNSRVVNSTEDSDYNSYQLESAMRSLKKLMMQEGFIKDQRRHEYHVTKGQRKRKAHKDAVLRETQRRNEEFKEWNPSALIGVHQNKKKKDKSK